MNKAVKKPWGMEINHYLMLMHLSQFSGVIVIFSEIFLPIGILAGAIISIIMPIIMWATNKDEFKEIDAHGKAILNWIFSSLIYFTISLVLITVVFGFLTLIIVSLLSLIFTIIAAVKASNGELWQYPLAIRFFKVKPVEPSIFEGELIEEVDEQK